ncbi:MAG: hypothetical protein A3F16_02435 [Deltaproteobacteria bacterium RIFCSPHIGHO2_12_FULL_43_9]|nr:MAG: hypothetical protein A3F16_02435 [Deltaproteobacteria bacterium RIFCSPHIGHO2_12_FULL_43_9]
MKINSIPLDERPREKGLKFGLEKLDDPELLAIFLGSGTKGENAIELARKVLDAFQFSIRGLGEATLDELVKIKGIGTCKALVIESLGEWGRRYASRPISYKVTIQTSFEVYKHFYERFSNQKEEQLLVILLDTKKRLIGEVLIAKGGINKASIAVADIFRPAVKRGAAGIILIHNHPSGDPSPSGEDFGLTVAAKGGGEILGIRLIDHLIIGSKGYYSFTESKLYREPALHQ